MESAAEEADPGEEDEREHGEVDAPGSGPEEDIAGQSQKERGEEQDACCS
jgi:hypothetical protein